MRPGRDLEWSKTAEGFRKPAEWAGRGRRVAVRLFARFVFGINLVADWF
jgi:hypothetical protein